MAKQFSKAQRKELVELMVEVLGSAGVIETPQPTARLAVAASPATAAKHPQVTRVKCGGNAPSITGAHNMPDAAATINARLLELEQLVPGISKIAYIFHVGRNAANKDEKTVGLMVNNPYTYIEFPGGKACTIGNMTGQQIFDTIKVHGYGFTKQKDASGNLQHFWATTCSGDPVRRQRFGSKRNTAANMVDAD